MLSIADDCHSTAAAMSRGKQARAEAFMLVAGMLVSSDILKITEPHKKVDAV